MERTTSRIRPGGEVPTGEPRRYTTSDGYTVLRWKTGVNRYVEVLEHRAVAGIPPGQVHHRDGERTNNTPGNLAPFTAAEHSREHRRHDYAAAADLYRAGLTTVEIAAKMGTHAGNVSRMLRDQGTEARTWRRPSPCTDEDVIRLYGQGMRPRQIAAKLGCSDAPVRRIMREQGLPAYPPGRPQR